MCLHVFGFVQPSLPVILSKIVLPSSWQRLAGIVGRRLDEGAWLVRGVLADGYHGDEVDESAVVQFLGEGVVDLLPDVRAVGLPQLLRLGVLAG